MTLKATMQHCSLSVTVKCVELFPAEPFPSTTPPASFLKYFKRSDIKSKSIKWEYFPIPFRQGASRGWPHNAGEAFVSDLISTMKRTRKNISNTADSVSDCILLCSATSLANDAAFSSALISSLVFDIISCLVFFFSFSEA
nr:hypothetical protein Iba_chr01eCG5280 [Ipomoea batatas]GMC56444.1 hypothetical protein Iba_chr01fCG7140 [Ipomoea batatas]